MHAAALIAGVMISALVLSISTLPVRASGPTSPAAGSVTSPISSPAGGSVANPQADGQSAGQTIANPLRYNSLDALLSAVLAAAIQLGSIILTIAIVFVGFRFVAARGNEEKIRSARTALMWTIIGGLILLGATAIQSVITSTVSSLTT